MQKLEETKKEPPKWRREPEKRPNDILDGALIEFCSRGFMGARIEDIARHAGLSKGTVYLYFDSKEEMLKALVRRSVTPIAQNMGDIAGHISDHNSSAVQILTSMLMMMAGRLSDDKIGAIPPLIIGEAGNFPELATFYREEVIEKAMKALKMVIEFGIKRGEFRKENSDFAIRTLIGAVFMQIIWNNIFVRANEEKLPYEEFIRAHINIFLNGIVVPKEA